MKKTRNHSQCRAKTKDGKPCRAAAVSNGLCLFHGNPNLASELGRKGGRSKRHISSETADPLPSLDAGLIKSAPTIPSDISTMNRASRPMPGNATPSHWLR